MGLKEKREVINSLGGKRQVRKHRIECIPYQTLHMVGKIMLALTPKDAHVLVPGTCEFVILHDIEEFRLQIKFRLLIC